MARKSFLVAHNWSPDGDAKELLSQTDGYSRLRCFDGGIGPILLLRASRLVALIADTIWTSRRGLSSLSSAHGARANRGLMFPVRNRLTR